MTSLSKRRNLQENHQSPFLIRLRDKIVRINQVVKWKFEYFYFYDGPAMIVEREKDTKLEKDKLGKDSFEKKKKVVNFHNFGPDPPPLKVVKTPIFL